MSKKIPRKLIPCGCGCGEMILNRDKRGYPRRFKNLHQNRGKNNPKFNNGIYFNTEGYKFVFAPNHPHCNRDGFVLEHRLVMEKYLNRYLMKTELIHHINENPSDNRLENLMVVTQSEHRLQHERIRKLNISCLICKKKSLKDQWHSDPLTREKWLCHICYWRRYRKFRKLRDGISI